MTQTHTPGPWAIEYKTQSDYPHLYITYESATRSQIIADLHCPVTINAVGEVANNDNKAANARLIAAAPTMLAALEAAYKSLAWARDVIGDIPDGSVFSETIEHARGAIHYAKEA